MIERNVIFGPRQSGKTYAIMTDIHDRIISGERSDVLVVFPAMSHLTWWRDEWNKRFPHLPMPDYTSMNAMERVRGKRVKHVYVEDIDSDGDGIYADKLTWLYPCIIGDGSITFTCSPIPGNDTAHREPPPPTRIEDIERKKAKILRRLYDAYMIQQMMKAINHAEG